MSAKTLSVVIPVYNEEAILEREVKQIIKEMSETFPSLDYEIFLVENGSHDRTRDIVKDLVEKNEVVRAVYLPDAGYGRALKEGLTQNNSIYTALFNTDFWDVQFLVKSLKMIKDEAVDIIVGSKTMRGAEDTRPLLRRAITLSFNGLLKLLFGFKGTDTHGMKLLVTEKIKPIIQKCETEKEIFDTEFILRSQMAGLSAKEIPVMCAEKRRTTLKISKRIPRTVKDLIVLFFSLKFGGLNKNKFDMGKILLPLIILFFLGVSFWGFPDSPAPWFDEGVNLGIAKTFVQDGIFSLRLAQGEYVQERTMMISTNYPVLFPITLFFYLFGIGLAPARIVMFLFLCLFLFLAYKFILKNSGKKSLALAGIALAVTFLPFYGNGLGGGLGEVPGLVYFLGGLLLLDKEKKWKVFLAGILLGLAVSTKVFYLVILGAVGIGELYFAILNRKFYWQRWLTIGLGVLIPLAVWLRTLLPNGFNLEGINQMFTYYNNPYQTANTTISNLLKFFTESTPIHFAVLALVFLIYCLMRFKNKNIKKEEIIIFVFVALNFVWFLRTPGWYRYLFPAHLLVLVLFPLALSGIFGMLNFKVKSNYAVGFLIGLLLAVQTVHMIDNRGTGLYHNPVSGNFAQELGEIIPEGKSVFIIDHPELWFLYDNPMTKQYMQMNPYIAFGEDVFASMNLPDYIIAGEPSANIYLSSHLDQFSELYSRDVQSGPYVIFKLKL